MSRAALGAILVACARPLVIPFVAAFAAAINVAEDAFGFVSGVLTHDAAAPLSPSGALASSRLFLTPPSRGSRLGRIILTDLADDDFAVERKGLQDDVEAAAVFVREREA
jgi:hypothetical protein